jgi:DNA repair exonuclease SbcCD ATPase subunit
MEKIKYLKTLIDKNTFIKDSLEDKKREIQEDINNINKETDTLLELKDFLMSVSANYRDQLCNLFTSLVTEALTSIFEKDIRFNIKLYSYRNEPAIDVSVIEDNLEVDPQKSCGGGLNDIISFVIKIIFIYLKKSSKIIILDEPLKFLSRDYIEQSSNFIHEISKRMNIQIILVSHKPDLEISCDKLINIEKSENRSMIK